MNYPVVQPPRRKPSGQGATRLKRPGQVLAAEQDTDLMTRHKCTEHLIEYYWPKGEKPRCPMCAQTAMIDDLRADNLALEGANKQMKSELQRLRVQLDIQTAVRSAIEVLDDNDYSWLKVQLYQYKIDKSVSLKPTHGKLEGGKRIPRGQKLPVNGFMTVPRKGDPEAHLCTSIGGIAMAEYLDEAITTMGSAQAMGMLLKAWWKALPGGQA